MERVFKRLIQCLGFLCVFVISPSMVYGQLSLISRQEALASLFPGATITSEQIFLTAEQIEKIENISREKVRWKLYLRFIATHEGQIIGLSYVDTHVVRTKRESLLISLSPGGHVLRIDVTAFFEPPEYIPDERWFGQYEGETVGPEIKLGRAIQPILGATLTSRAVNSAVRRIHAINAVLQASKQ